MSLGPRAFLIALLGIPLLAQVTVPSTHSIAERTEAYGKLPLSFEANRGQTDAQVRFLSRGDGYSLFLTPTAAVLSLRQPKLRSAGSGQPSSEQPGASPSTRVDVIRMELAGANPAPRLEGMAPLAGTANYFLGNDPARWHTGVPTFARVGYAAVYPGVDLVYYGNQGRLEYDFVLKPHADPRPIRLHFAGARQLRLSAAGDLEVEAAHGAIAFHKPVVYQEVAGLRRPVAAGFALLANHTVTFSLGHYDPTLPLTIDPTLAYSTYLGGSSGSAAAAIAVDAFGSAYLTGETVDADFPVTTGSYQIASHGPAGVSNVFVTKLNPAGTAIMFSTYIGGSGNSSKLGDAGTAIAVDQNQSIYVAGYANSSDFPLKNAFQSVNKAATLGLCEPFVAKLSGNGSTLLYSTYLGGTSHANTVDQGDRAYGIAVNSSGNSYVTGVTYSADFPTTPGAFQTVAKGAFPGNAFVSELSLDGSSLVYSTYLGGSGTQSMVQSVYRGDGARGLAVDAAGNAYVTGVTGSTDFPTTPGVIQPTNHASVNQADNAFVTKLDPAGAHLVYSTYLGGASTATPRLTCFGCNNGDGGAAIVVDKAGDAYVAGGTYSTDFPVTAGAFQTTKGGVANAFAAKLNPTGTSLLYSTYLGGGGSLGDIAYGAAIDDAGDLYLSGFTSSANFRVTPDAFQSNSVAVAEGAMSAFLSEVNPAGSGLVYSTYLGGSKVTSAGDASSGYFGDVSYGLAMDPSGSAYLTGGVTSGDFPTTNGAYQGTNRALSSAFISKFSFNATAAKGSLVTVFSSANPINAGTALTFTAFVQSTSGGAIPTGNTTFMVDGKSVYTATIDSTGHATYTTSSLPAGSHTITANYAGDGTYPTSTSGSLTQVVSPPTITVTSVAGANQTGPIGTAYRSQIVVQVMSGTVPAVGVLVTFSGPGFTFSSTSAPTNGSGYAFVSGTPHLAGLLTVTASVNGSAFVLIPERATSTASPTMPIFASMALLTTGSSAAGQSLLAVAADFNRDGKLDLAATNNSDSAVGVLYGNGTGSFKAPLISGVGHNTLGLATGDFDGDGIADLAAVNGDDNTVSVLLGKNALRATGLYKVGSQPYAIATADLNRDGFLDLVVTNTNDNTISVLFGKGDGTFLTAIVYATGMTPFAVTVVDLNNDGYPDLAVANTTDSTVSVFLNDRTGKFPASIVSPTAYEPFSVTAGDFNGDGLVDLAVANIGGAAVTVHLGDGTGRFFKSISYTVGVDPSGVLAVDMNGDGILDLAVANLGSGTVGMLIGKGDGTFYPQVTVPAGVQPYALVAGDFNGDGMPDVAVTSFFANTLGLLMQTTPAAGAGHIQRGPQQPVTGGPSRTAQ